MYSKFIKLIVLLSLLVCCGFAGRVLYGRFPQLCRTKERSTSQLGSSLVNCVAPGHTVGSKVRPLPVVDAAGSERLLQVILESLLRSPSITMARGQFAKQDDLSLSFISSFDFKHRTSYHISFIRHSFHGKTWTQQIDLLSTAQLVRALHRGHGFESR